MALREIVVDDVWWVVFPSRGGRSAGDGAWLYARSLCDERRIARLPCDWDRWSDAELSAAIRQAQPLPPLPLP